MKKTATMALVLIMLISLAAPAALAANEVDVMINGSEVAWTDAQPFIDENGRTLVPLRAVADAMGLTVEWDATERVAVFSRAYTMEDSLYYTEGDEYYTGKIEVRFYIDSTTAYFYYEDYPVEGEGEPDISGGNIEMDTAAIIVDGRTYAPVRYLAEEFGYIVDWNAETRTVEITEFNGYVLYWDAFGAEGDSLGVYYFPGERFDEYGEIVVTGGKVDGAEAEVVPLTDDELDAVREDFPNAVYAFYLVCEGVDFTSTEVGYLIEWEYALTFADGIISNESTEYMWNWELEGLE